MVDALPDELIREIVKLAIMEIQFERDESRLDAFLGYQKISKQWKHALEDDCILWAACVDFKDTSTRFDTTLERSANALLDVGNVHRLRGMFSFGLKNNCKDIHPILSRMAAVKSRLRTLRIYFTRPCCVAVLFPPAINSLPNLQNCCITTSAHDKIPVSFHPAIVAPMLRYSQMSWYLNSPISVAPTQTIQEMDWTCDWPNLGILTKLIEFLRQLPGLRKCDLSICPNLRLDTSTPDMEIILDVPRNRHKVFLSRMNELSLDAPTFFILPFFENFTFPHGCHMDIEVKHLSSPEHSFYRFLDIFHEERFTGRAVYPHGREVEISNGHRDYTVIEQPFSEDDNPQFSALHSRTVLYIYHPAEEIAEKLILALYDMVGPSYTNVVRLTHSIDLELTAQAVEELYSKLEGFSALRVLTIENHQSSIYDIFEQFNPNLFPSLHTLDEVEMTCYQTQDFIRQRMEQTARILRARAHPCRYKSRSWCGKLEEEYMFEVMQLLQDSA